MDESASLYLMEVCVGQADNLIPDSARYGQTKMTCAGLSEIDLARISRHFRAGYNAASATESSESAHGRENPVPQYELVKLPHPDYATLYCAARTISLGPEDFFTHIFVSTDPIPVGVFDAIERQGLWMPADITPSLNNTSLTDFFVREPFSSSPIELIIDQLPLSAIADRPEMAKVISALVEARRNAIDGASPSLQKVIVIATADSTPFLLRLMSALPRELTDGLTIATNYISSAKDQPLPDEIGMAFVNEHCTSLPDLSQHITIDLIDGTRSCNLGKSVFQQQITGMAESGQFVTLSQMLHWWLGLEPEPASDCDKTFALFLGADTDMPLTADLANEQLVEQASHIADPGRRERILRKFNRLISETLTQATSSQFIREALSLAEAVGRYFTVVADITPEARQRLARLLFQRGKKAYLGRLVNKENVATVTALIQPELMGDGDTLADALIQSRSTTVWRMMLNHYFHGETADYLPQIMDMIGRSVLTPDQRDSLSATLFPVTDYATPLIEWYKNNPSMISAIPGPVTTICLGAHEECFSRLTDSYTPAETTAQLKPLVKRYFMPRMTDNPDLALSMLLKMARRMGAELFARIASNELIDAYLDDACRRPSAITAAATDAVARSEIRLTDRQAARFEALRAVSEQTMPQAVTPEVMLMARKLEGDTLPYRTALFEQWLVSAPSIEALTSYLDQASISEPDTIENMITAIWKAPSRKIAAERVDYIRELLNKSPLDKDDLKAFAADCGDEELSHALLGRSWLGRLFGKKKN